MTTLPPTGDIVDILLAQHEQIREHLDDVANATGQHRVEAFKALARVLHIHEQGEQHVVHPVTRDRVAAPEVATERVAEEHQADIALGDLAGLGLDTSEFDRRFAEFRAAVLAHAQHEQDEEFPLLRTTQTSEQLLAMANQLRTVQSMI